MTAVRIRGRTPDDDVHIVGLLNRASPEARPMTLSRYRAHLELHVDRPAIRLVAGIDGAVVGHAALDHAWWAGRPEVYSVDVAVDPDHVRRGIGHALYRALTLQGRELGVTELCAWVPESPPHALRFAERLGFVPAGERLEESRLVVADARLDGFTGRENRLHRSGICLRTLAELGPPSDTLLQSLCTLTHEPGTQLDRRFYEIWRRHVIDGPGHSPHWHWIAFHGDRVVGHAYMDWFGDDSAESDYTAVVPGYRGRGIARALKLRSVEWARESGVRYLFTSSDVENTRMLAINHSLGFQPTGHLMAMRKAL